MMTINTFLKAIKRIVFLVILFLVNPVFLKAQEIIADETKAPLVKPLARILFQPEFYLGTLVLLLLLASVAVLSYAVLKLTKLLLPVPVVKNITEVVADIAITKELAKEIAIQEEQEMMTDHVYDGIRELDNSLPPWWVKMFYCTIAFAIIYILHFHVFKTGKLQADEYKKELVTAEQQKEEYRKLSANNVDESNVIALTDAAILDEGKSMFVSKCSPCHGAKGEGIVGPNLTDEFWLHGGGIQNIFKTIKYGVPQKGMIAWETQLKPTDIQKISSYILTLKGSNPANGKAPQGDLYKEEIGSDSLVVKK